MGGTERLAGTQANRKPTVEKLKNKITSKSPFPQLRQRLNKVASSASYLSKTKLTKASLLSSPYLKVEYIHASGVSNFTPANQQSKHAEQEWMGWLF